MDRNTMKYLPYFGTHDLDNHSFSFVYPAPARSFLSLPAELRLPIYHHLGFSTCNARTIQTSRHAVDAIPVRAYYNFLSGDGKHTQRSVQRPLRPLVPGKGIHTSIMRTCRKISDECYLLLYANTAVGIRWDMPAERGWGTEVGKGILTSFDHLHFPLGLSTRVLGVRALSYLTHVTLGPLPVFKARDRSANRHRSSSVGVYVRGLTYIAPRCPNLKALGIHFPERSTTEKSAAEAILPLLKALGNVVRCCRVEKFWVGVGDEPRQNVEVDLLKDLAKAAAAEELGSPLALPPIDPFQSRGESDKRNSSLRSALIARKRKAKDQLAIAANKINATNNWIASVENTITRSELDLDILRQTLAKNLVAGKELIKARTCLAEQQNLGLDTTTVMMTTVTTQAANEASRRSIEMLIDRVMRTKSLGEEQKQLVEGDYKRAKESKSDAERALEFLNRAEQALNKSEFSQGPSSKQNVADKVQAYLDTSCNEPHNQYGQDSKMHGAYDAQQHAYAASSVEKVLLHARLAELLLAKIKVETAAERATSTSADSGVNSAGAEGRLAEAPKASRSIATYCRAQVLGKSLTDLTRVLDCGHDKTERVPGKTAVLSPLPLRNPATTNAGTEATPSTAISSNSTISLRSSRMGIPANEPPSWTGCSLPPHERMTEAEEALATRLCQLLPEMRFRRGRPYCGWETLARPRGESEEGRVLRAVMPRR